MKLKISKHPCTVYNMNSMVDQSSVVICNIELSFMVCAVVE